MKIGNLVRGLYKDTYPIEGMIVAFDGSGYTHVRILHPVPMFGDRNPREEVCFDRHERKALSVVGDGPEIAPEDLVELPYDCVGGTSIRNKAAARIVAALETPCSPTTT